MASSVTCAAFLPFSGVGSSMHCREQLHWRSDLPVDMQRGWIRSWFCTSSRLGYWKCLRENKLQNNGPEMVVLEGNGKKIVASETQSVSHSPPRQ